MIASNTLVLTVRHRNPSLDNFNIIPIADLFNAWEEMQHLAVTASIDIKCDSYVLQGILNFTHAKDNVVINNWCTLSALLTARIV